MSMAARYLHSLQGIIKPVKVRYVRNSFFSLKIVKDRLLSPEEAAEDILKVTRNDVVYAARGVKLHTVYKLLPNDKEGEN